MNLTLLVLVLAAGAFTSVRPPIHSCKTPSAAQPEDPQELGHGYQRRGHQIWFKGKRIDAEGRSDIAKFAASVGHALTLCHDVDAATFVPLSEQYSKDKNRVYYKWISPGRFWVVEMPDADPATFEVLDSDLAKDGNRVWRSDVVVPGADPETVEVVNPRWTWKDRHRVYYQSRALEGADPATFRHLDQAFYRDAEHVFWGTTMLDAADVESFETFGDVPYARDRAHVWSGATVLPDVDAASFELLHNHVYKDARHVFVSTRAVEVLNADPTTFVKIDRIGGHRSVFEPGKRSVSFPGHDAVLFRDARRYYVFEPDYSEMYRLEAEGDVVHIFKPVWRPKPAGRPVHVATVSAALRGESLADPVLEVLSSGQPDSSLAGEKEKLKRALPMFLAARELMVK